MHSGPDRGLRNAAAARHGAPRRAGSRRFNRQSRYLGQQSERRESRRRAHLRPAWGCGHLLHGSRRHWCGHYFQQFECGGICRARGLGGRARKRAGDLRLPFVIQTTMPSGFTAGPVAGTGAYVPGFSPISSTGQPPDGDLITPTNGPLGGLTAAQVITILDQAEATANMTRAAIRLPLGSTARMVIAVSDLDGTFIGLRRMPDATIFSVDVAASKARNMTYFNSPTVAPTDLPGVPLGTAVTNRTISFGAMPLYPPGIGGNPPPANPGPFFNLFLQDTANTCTQGAQTGAANDKKSGIVFSPGSPGFFINGRLVGGRGGSGEGGDRTTLLRTA